VLVLQTFPYGLAFLLQKFPQAGMTEQGSNVVSSTPPLRIASVERFTSLDFTSLHW
jgi:hypothetical protein